MGQVKKILAGSFLFAIGLVLAGCVFDSPDKSLTLGGHEIKVEIVDTAVSRVNGLSGRESLCASCGMLFVYDNSAKRAFWMKNMNFPLDIIWLNDNRAVGFSEALEPEGEEPSRTYASPEPVDMVLEVNAGFVAKNGIKAGDPVQLGN
ncbi:MAG: DUF192 domain-containing protein [Patescibacteria group bacterium]|jgi:hypothetical protein